MSGQAKAFSLSAYMQTNCIQFEGRARGIGIALHQAMEGFICNGCPKFNDGVCPDYKQLLGSTQLQSTPKAQQETVREEATRLGISIKEVRRRRNADRINKLKAQGHGHE